MKRRILLSIALLCCLSCVSHKKEILKKSTIKLEGKNTNIQDLLDIDGYYTSAFDQKNLRGTMFFEDGSWASFYFKRDVADSDIKNNLSESISSRKKNKLTRWGTYWGVYTLKNDTIILHRYTKGTCWGNSWSVEELRCKVVDRQTIKYIYIKSLMERDKSYYEDHSPSRDGGVCYFIRTDSLPSPDCWLKEEKWIWRNELDWKAYMEKVKTEKKQQISNH